MKTLLKNNTGNAASNGILISGERKTAAPLWQSITPSWPLLIGLISLAVLYRPERLLGDPDIYMHIAAGRYMIFHHSLPSQDPFSYSLAGAHWVVHEWLAELISAVVYNWAGWSGMAALGALCLSFSLTMMTRRLLRHFDPLPALILIFGSFMLMEPHLLVRAHLLSLPLMVIWCVELIAARDAGRRPSVWTLLVIVLWANMHGGYMFGLAFAAALGIEAVCSSSGSGRWLKGRGWFVFVVLAAACTLINPNGLEGFLEPFRLSSMPTLQSTFSEWLSPDFQKIQPLEIWILGLIFIAFSTGSRLPFFRVVFLMGFIHISLEHARHQDIMAVAVPLLLAAPLGPQINRLTRSDPPTIISRFFASVAGPSAKPAIALTAVLTIAVTILTLMHPIDRKNGAVTPLTALEAARKAHLSGPVFNSEAFGGYLIFNGIKTYIDGRIEMYGDDFLKHYVEMDKGDEAALSATLTRYGVEWTLLNPKGPVAIIMDHMPGWRLVFKDDYAAVHARIDKSGP